jgi:hypothetical protein
MSNPPSLPQDIRASLAQGINDILEDNATRFLAKFKEPRDEQKDWYNGFHRLNLQGMTGFELSVRLGWLVDELSTLSGLSKGSVVPRLSPEDMEPLIVTVLNAEYLILKLTSAIPLRDHPFLLHWVTTVDRIRGDLLANRDKLGATEYGIQEVFLKSRLEIIYCALKGMEEFAGVDGWPEKHVGTLTPLQLMEHTLQIEGEPAWLDLTPYAMILDEAGITLSWELAALLPDPDPSTRSPTKQLANLNIDSTPSPVRGKATAPTTPTAPTKSSVPSISDIEKYLRIEPVEIIRLLTRLPLDIPSLDLLTKLNESDILDNAGADTVHITREYVQHCLREIEKMGQDSSNSSNTSNVSANPSEESSEPARGREEQSRAVRLLVMFIKNLVRKGLCPVHELVYEIQEVCVRYIFVSEVREFRAWLEGGDEEVKTAGRGLGG